MTRQMLCYIFSLVYDCRGNGEMCRKKTSLKSTCSWMIGDLIFGSVWTKQQNIKWVSHINIWPCNKSLCTVISLPLTLCYQSTNR